MRSTLGLALLTTGLGCAQVSGLNDFVGGAEGGGGAGGSSSGPGPGSGGSGAGSSTGGGGSVVVADGPLIDLGPVEELNTASDEDDPTFTPDGLELYFNSDRNGPVQIWHSTRASVDDPWGTPEMVSQLSPSGNDSNPVLSPDGLTIWIRTSGATQMVATRATRDSPWSELSITDEVPAGSYEVVNAVTADGLTLMVNDSSNLLETHRSSTADPWDPLMTMAGLDGSNKQEGWMSVDGRYVYWGGGGALHRAVRPSITDPFAPAETLPEPSNLGGIRDPWLTEDQRYLMFTVGSKPRDIWQARRR
jgi:hypothetical protein